MYLFEKICLRNGGSHYWMVGNINDLAKLSTGSLGQSSQIKRFHRPITRQVASYVIPKNKCKYFMA